MPDPDRPTGPAAPHALRLVSSQSEAWQADRHPPTGVCGTATCAWRSTASVHRVPEFNEEVARRYFEAEGLLRPVEHPLQAHGTERWGRLVGHRSLRSAPGHRRCRRRRGQGVAHRGDHAEPPARVAEPVPLHPRRSNGGRSSRDRRPSVPPRPDRRPRRRPPSRRSSGLRSRQGRRGAGVRGCAPGAHRWHGVGALR